MILTLQLINSPAGASCAAPVSFKAAIRDAPAVFVGNVIDVTNGRRWATVEVTDVWKGVVENEVEVKAGPKDPPGPGGVATSVDRYYKLGQTYLFVVHRGAKDLFRDSSCSRTTRYRAQLERFRPESQPSPTPSPSIASSDEQGSARWWVVAGVLLALLGGFALRRFRS